MNTPMNANEIVKALRADCEDCSECGVEDKQCYGLYYCPNRDAADLIESQAAEIVRLTQSFNAVVAGQVTLQRALKASQRRERAAVADLKHTDNCDICKHSIDDIPGCGCECDLCGLDCVCKDCRDEDRWQWRGVGEGEKV